MNKNTCASILKIANIEYKVLVKVNVLKILRKK